MKYSFLLLISILAGLGVHAQQTRAFNQNASRSNHTRSAAMPVEENALIFRLNGGVSKAIADSIAASPVFIPSATLQYYAGKIGVGVEAGGFSNNPHFDVHEYTSRIRSFTTTEIKSTSWKTWYVLAGPSYRKSWGRTGSVGHPLQLSADLYGGIMKMQPASFSVRDTENGTLIADYYSQRKEHTDIERQLFALKPAIRFEWFPGGKNIGFNLAASYLHAFGAKEITTYYRDLSKIQTGGLSPAEVRAQVLQAPVVESHTAGAVSNYSLSAGISIRLNTIKSAKGINEAGFKNASAPRESITGLPTGKRSAPVNNNTGNAPGCGPVTQTTVAPDGSRQETTFSCVADAIAFRGYQPNGTTPAESNLRQVVTTSRQTQGNSFGERISTNTGNTDKNLKSYAVIAGKLSWASQHVSGIVTNQSPEQARQQTSFAILLSLRGREAGSGIATGKRSREAGSGMATGRRQYQPIYIEGNGTGFQSQPVLMTPLYSGGGTSGSNPLFEGSSNLKSNPLYSGNGNSGANPLHQNAAKESNPLYSAGGHSADNPLFTGSHFTSGGPGVGGVNISLVEIASGAVLANTVTESDGTFFFARVPGVAYTLSVSGNVQNYKSYDLALNQPTELDGQLTYGNEQLQLELLTDTKGDSGNVYKTGQQQPAGLSRKLIPLYGTGYEAGSPVPDVLIEGSVNGMKTGSFYTDENGNFQFAAQQAGRYSFTTKHSFRLEDALEVSVRASDDNAGGFTNTNATQPAPITKSETVKTIFAEADMDGDGVYETDVTQAVAEELLLDENGSVSPRQKAGISTSRSNIRTRSAVQYRGDGIYISYVTAIINGEQTQVKTYLKTKHDTAKNSVSNIR